MGNILGGKINPVQQQPIVGSGTQQEFLQALFNTGIVPTAGGTMRFAPVAPYTGQLSPQVNANLQNAYGSWQPWNAGTMYQANALPQIAGGIGPTKQASPGISNMQQFGSPSAVGNYLGNIAQFGSAGPAGQPLENLATGSLGGPASYLTPWLGGGASGPTSLYRPPSIFGAPGTTA